MEKEKQNHNEYLMMISDTSVSRANNIVAILIFDYIEHDYVRDKVILYSEKPYETLIINVLEHFDIFGINLSRIQEKLEQSLKSSVIVHNAIPFVSENLNKSSRNKRMLEIMGKGHLHRERKSIKIGTLHT